MAPELNIDKARLTFDIYGAPGALLPEAGDDEVSEEQKEASDEEGEAQLREMSRICIKLFKASREGVTVIEFNRVAGSQVLFYDRFGYLREKLAAVNNVEI